MIVDANKLIEAWSHFDPNILSYTEFNRIVSDNNLGSSVITGRIDLGPFFAVSENNSIVQEDELQRILSETMIKRRLIIPDFPEVVVLTENLISAMNILTYSGQNLGIIHTYRNNINYNIAESGVGSLTFASQFATQLLFCYMLYHPAVFGLTNIQLRRWKRLQDANYYFSLDKNQVSDEFYTFYNIILPINQATIYKPEHEGAATLASHEERFIIELSIDYLKQYFDTWDQIKAAAIRLWIY